MKKILTYLLICISLTGLAFGQEALKSTEEEYYDFLALSGLVTPPALGYRTLSDSVWELPEDTEHVWQDNNLGSTRTLWEDEDPKENLFLTVFSKALDIKSFLLNGITVIIQLHHMDRMTELSGRAKVIIQP